MIVQRAGMGVSINHGMPQNVRVDPINARGAVIKIIRLLVVAVVIRKYGHVISTVTGIVSVDVLARR